MRQDDTVSIVIPTHKRPDLLGRAIRSALAQSADGLEVVVVDDGSDPPVDPETIPALDDPGVTLIRRTRPGGVSVARNTGLRAATGKWVSFLDDDDELVPGMIARSLEAIAASELPPPVASLSSLDIVDSKGNHQKTRKPPTLSKGGYFGLDPVPRGISLFTKHSLVIDRGLLMSLGGFDEEFFSRNQTELFLRLSPVCSLQGVEQPGYRHMIHDGGRISGDPVLREK